jgi:translation initiation factor 1
MPAKNAKLKAIPPGGWSAGIRRGHLIQIYPLLLRPRCMVVSVGTDRRNDRTVYSTGSGRVCPGCGWPARECRCSKGVADDPVPARIVAKLRLEKAGRAGKTVTVVYGLPRNSTFLKELCGELKRTCGTGGAVSEDTVELQGDHRARARDVLLPKGFVVKG